MEKNSNTNTNNMNTNIDLRMLFPTEITEVKTKAFTPLSTGVVSSEDTVRNKLKFKSKQDRFNESLKNSNDVKKYWKAYRKAAGDVWVDPTMEEWEENDYRIFVGDLGNEVTDELLKNAFMKYSSFLKARVVRDSRTGKSKGYGFVSLKDPDDYMKAMEEMQGKYIGNRPCRLMRSKWKDRTVKYSKSKLQNWKFVKDTAKNIEKIKNKYEGDINMTSGINNN